VASRTHRDIRPGRPWNRLDSARRPVISHSRRQVSWPGARP
jgi:hypothetical protein